MSQPAQEGHRELPLYLMVLVLPLLGQERDTKDLRGETLIYQIYPLEMKIGGDLELP